jgi:PAB1-binding protein PBP1
MGAGQPVQGQTNAAGNGVVPPTVPTVPVNVTVTPSPQLTSALSGIEVGAVVIGIVAVGALAVALVAASPTRARAHARTSTRRR